MTSSCALALRESSTAGGAGHEGATVRRVLAFGDSLTAGYWGFGSRFTPYSTRLGELLGSAWEVTHVGLCGWTARRMALDSELDAVSAVDVCGHEWDGGLRTHLRRAREEGRPFEVLIVLAGTNDLGDVLDGECTAADVADACLSLHSAGRDAGCRVVALTVPEHGQEGQYPALARVRAEINTRLATLPAGAVTLVDVAAALPQTERELWDDALHFSQTGYERLGQTVHESAAAAFQ